MRPDAPLANNMSHGFWNHAFDIGRYRVINQTADCTGPPLVVLEKPPHDALVLGRVGPVPPAVVSARTDFVHLVVSKGTLVPKAPVLREPLAGEARLQACRAVGSVGCSVRAWRCVLAPACE